MSGRTERTDHRPWPLPDGPWAWRQSWHDLLFAHWPVAAAELRPLIPSALTVQEFAGRAWLGVVPFRMTGVTRRPLPPLPGLSAFPELNLRTYVELGGKPGVWFFSLDAASLLAVRIARLLFHLPYFHARMEMKDARARRPEDMSEEDAVSEVDRLAGEGGDDEGEAALKHESEDRRGPVGGGEIRYRSVRRRDPAGLTFAARYGPVSEPYESSPGTLEHWLTERYCLYAEDPDGRIHRTEIHHSPWPLQAAEADVERNELPDPHGLARPGEPELLHFSRRLDVVVWESEVLEG